MATVTFNITNNNMQQQNDFFNYYLTMNMNNICRICLEKGTRLMPIFDPVKPPHFSLLIMACAAVQVRIFSYGNLKNVCRWNFLGSTGRWFASLYMSEVCFQIKYCISI